MDSIQESSSTTEIISKFLGDIIAQITDEYLLSLIVLCLVLALFAYFFFGNSPREKIRFAVFVLVTFFFSGVAYAMFIIAKPSSPNAPLTPEVIDVGASEKIYIPASQLESGLNVAIGPIPNLYGPNVLMNAPPFNSRPNEALFRFNAKGGEYQLSIRYAAGERRPLDVSVNDVMVLNNVLDKETGGWLPKDQLLLPVGPITLRTDENTLKLTSPDVFPHITELRLEQLN